MLFSELKIQKEDFIATVDDTVTTYYGNGEKGLRYAVTSSGTVASVWHGPSIKQNKLRCAGFPATDGGVTAYKPYYEFQYEAIEDVDRLGEFGVRLVKERGFKGYVIIYGARDKKSDSIEKRMMAAKTT